MSNWPQQHVYINWTSVPTVEFVKNREGILSRLTWKEKDNIQEKFEKEVKKVKATPEKQPETPVVMVPGTTTLPPENSELDNVPLEEKKPQVETKTRWEIMKEYKAKFGKLPAPRRTIEEIQAKINE